MFPGAEDRCQPGIRGSGKLPLKTAGDPGTGRKSCDPDLHSGEDRLVKYYFKDGKKEGIYSDVASDVIRPSAEECQRNPRARSTKMRWAIRDGENPHRM